MKKALLLLIFMAGLLLGWSNVSYAQKICPPNDFLCYYRNVTTAAPASGVEILDIIRYIAGFLIIAGGILAGIAIIVSGIMFMAAGSNPARLTAAKAIFKNGVIGALILFAAGLIVNTIILLAISWQQFFS